MCRGKTLGWAKQTGDAEEHVPEGLEDVEMSCPKRKTEPRIQGNRPRRKG